jgi:hypothetical protein
MGGDYGRHGDWRPIHWIEREHRLTRSTTLVKRGAPSRPPSNRPRLVRLPARGPASA